MDVARDRKEETPLVGEVGADVTLDLEAKAGKERGGSAAAAWSPGRGGVADVGRPGGAVPLEAAASLSSSSPDRSPCEKRLFR